MLLAGAFGCWSLVGCSDNGADETTLTVFAASSLADVINEFTSEFGDTHPDVEVVVSLAASSTLADQISDGAPADVAILANEATMDRLTTANLAVNAVVVASNHITVAVAADGPWASAQTFDDLATGDPTVGLCQAGVPCGDAATAALVALGASIDADTAEPNVRALLSKLLDGELDVAFVYESDVAASNGALVAVPVLGITEPNLYVAAAIDRGNASAGLATQFISLLTSAHASDIFAAYGFDSP